MPQSGILPRHESVSIFRKVCSSLYRRAAILHFGAQAMHWGQAKIFVELELLRPEVLLTQARLRYLGHLAAKGQELFWAMVQTEQVWWTLIQTDFEWLRSFCPTEPCPCPTREWNDFADYVCEAPMRWKSLIKRAVRRSQTLLSANTNGPNGTRPFSGVCKHAVWCQAATLAELQGEHYCLQCRRVFDSAAACAVHSFKQHDGPTFVREYVTGTVCESCLRVYSRHSDLLNHVRYSQDCKQFYCDRGLAVLREPGVNSKVDDDARGTLPDPVLQAEGPKAMPPMNQGHQSYAQRQRTELWNQWNVSLRPRVSQHALIERLREATRSTTLYHNEILVSMSAWSQMPEVVEALTAMNACDVVQQFLDLASAAWFLQRELPVEVPTETIEHFFATQGLCLDMLPYIVPDAPRYKPRMVAHLFSGTRRDRDLQYYWEQMGFTALSIDIIFHKELGDLGRAATMDFFLKALQSGMLVGWVAGPPCETWSKARKHELPGGPRPVRSQQMPFGLQDLTFKEHIQVSTGSLLLGISFTLFWFSILSGATAVIEHPAEVGLEPNDPSILENLMSWLSFYAFRM